MGTLTDLRDYRVTKHNDLVEAGYRLSLNEQRIVLAAIAQLDSRKPPGARGKGLPKKKTYTIRADEFAETFGLELKHTYEALSDAANRLFERDIRTYDRAKQVRERFRWVSYVKYQDGLGAITLSFTDEVLPYLTMLHAKFTSYDIRQIVQLSSPHTIRIYELLRRLVDTGERTITLDDLRRWLDLEGRYSEWRDLRKRVLDPALREINATTDIEVEWETQRHGRKVVGLYFVLAERPQMQLPLE